MTPEQTAYVNSLIAIVWTLSALIVALALGWLLDDAETRKQLKQWWLPPSKPTEFCKLHQRPRTECRDEEHD